MRARSSTRGFFARHGVKSVFEQGNYSQGGNGEMEPLRSHNNREKPVSLPAHQRGDAESV